MRTSRLIYLTAAAILCRASLGWAATAACSTGQAPPPGRAPFERVTVDPITQARTVVRREADGKIHVDLVGKSAAVRKTLSEQVSTTILESGEHQVTVTLSGDTVTITTPDQVFSGSAGVPGSLTLAGAYLRQSTAAIGAKRLLDRVPLKATDAAGHALLLTKALLGSLWGEPEGAREHRQWAAGTLKRPRVARVALLNDPDECWDKYAKEAIRIADDYESCIKSCGWRFWCLEGCSVLYVIRAEGAFMWYVSCNGGFFVD